MELTLAWFAVLVASARAISCDKQSLPGLWFRLNGDELSWPCESTRRLYESSGRYAPRSVIATRVQVHRDQAYLAMPRFRPGVPFSLGVVSVKARAHVNLPATITAFPSFLLHEEGNCEAMQNVIDIFLDRLGVLWALDSGVVNGLEQPVKRCPPKVVAIELKSSEVVRVIDLGPFTNDQSRLQHLVVDCTSNDEIHLYVSDGGNRGLVVYNASNRTGFNVPLPRGATQDCPCASGDVLYLALVGKAKRPATLYFTYLGSDRLWKIGSDKLREGRVQGFAADVGRKDEKIVLLGWDDDSAALFFRNKGQSDVYAWNTSTDFKSDHFSLLQEGNDCRLPTHVVPGGKKLTWVLESNFQDYIENSVASAGASVVLHPAVSSC